MHILEPSLNIEKLPLSKLYEVIPNITLLLLLVVTIVVVVVVVNVPVWCGCRSYISHSYTNIKNSK